MQYPNREAHLRRLEENARRAATREVAARNGQPLSLEELGRLRIQTAEPWARILVAILSIGVSTLGIMFLREDFPIIGMIVILIALGGLALAYVGRKRPIDTVLNTVDLIDLLGCILESIDL